MNIEESLSRLEDEVKGIQIKKKTAEAKAYLEQKGLPAELAECINVDMETEFLHGAIDRIGGIIEESVKEELQRNRSRASESLSFTKQELKQRREEFRQMPLAEMAKLMNESPELFAMLAADDSGTMPETIEEFNALSLSEQVDFSKANPEAYARFMEQ